MTKMTKAKIISTQGPYLEANLEIDGQRFCVMDEFSVAYRYDPLLESEIEFEFSNSIDQHEAWEEMFSSNPDQRTGIEQIDGWKYRAFGKIISINPVRVDCGIFVEEGVIHTHDARVIGEFIAFTISRLGGYGHAIRKSAS